MRLTMILGGVSNFFNTLKEIFFQIVERLETLLKITIKHTLNLKLGGVLSFFLVVNFYLFIYLFYYYYCYLPRMLCESTLNLKCEIDQGGV